MPENLPINILDVFILLTVVLGALIGLVLGIVRAGLFILSWLGAGASTLYGLSTARSFTRPYIKEEFYADLVAGVAVFLGSLVILFLLSSFISGWVRKSKLNSLDRSLGMLAGLLTTLIILLGGILAVDNIVVENRRPTIMLESKSLPLLRQYAVFVNERLPKELQQLDPGAVNKAVDQTKKALEKNIYDRLIRSGQVTSNGDSNAIINKDTQNTLVPSK